MNENLMRQRFISGLLVILSVTSMALLKLQFLTSALGSPASTTGAGNIDSRLAGGGFYWWTDIMQGLLLLNLLIVALISLFNLRLSRRPEAISPGNKPVHDGARVI